MQPPIDRRLDQRVLRWLLALAGTGALVAVALGLDVLHHGSLSRRDPDWLQFFVDHRSRTVVDSARWITFFGSYWTLVVIGVAAAAVLLSRRTRLLAALAPLLALVVTGLVVRSTKAGVGRLRPPIGWQLVSVAGRSFPSGHAADSTALYLSIAIVASICVLRRPMSRSIAVVAAAVWSGLIGLTRWVLGVHFPTDVIAGWAIGVAFAGLVCGSTLAGSPGGGREDDLEASGSS